jgi:hypothetical protein
VNNKKLFAIKTIHTVIYLIMVMGIIYNLYAGITKTYNTLLYISFGLLILESIVFFAFGMKCPLTDLAKKYGDQKGYVGDIFLPKKIADNTFYTFGGLFVLGIVVIILNLLGIR